MLFSAEKTHAEQSVNEKDVFEKALSSCIQDEVGIVNAICDFQLQLRNEKTPESMMNKSLYFQEKHTLFGHSDLSRKKNILIQDEHQQPPHWRLSELSLYSAHNSSTCMSIKTGKNVFDQGSIKSNETNMVAGDISESSVHIRSNEDHIPVEQLVKSTEKTPIVATFPQKRFKKVHLELNYQNTASHNLMMSDDDSSSTKAYAMPLPFCGHEVNAVDENVSSFAPGHPSSSNIGELTLKTTEKQQSSCDAAFVKEINVTDIDNPNTTLPNQALHAKNKKILSFEKPLRTAKTKKSQKETGESNGTASKVGLAASSNIQEKYPQIWSAEELKTSGGRFKDHPILTGSARTDGYLVHLKHMLQKKENRPQEHKFSPNAFCLLKDKVKSLPINISNNPMTHSTEPIEKFLFVARSNIHSWGLFTSHKIQPKEYIIEYCGEIISNRVAFLREQHYIKQGKAHTYVTGIGSSYLFRCDENYVIDATQKGTICRFMNHSCNPNAFASVLDEDSAKKRILIFAKRLIEPWEEITYDYKFPIEDHDKIVCGCKSPGCRGFLN